MQLLTVIWVSSLWAILACGMMFHAEYVARITHQYVLHEEREAVLRACMRVACIQYQTDQLLRKEVFGGKQVVRRFEITRPVLGNCCALECAYRVRADGGVEIYCVVIRGKSVWGRATHLFPARAFAVIQGSM